MNTRALVLGVFLSAGSAATSLSAEQVLLDADSAVRMAVENNLALQRARIDLSILQRARDTAWNQYLPSLSASASFSHLQTITTAGSADPTPWGLSATVSSTLPLSASIGHQSRGAALEYDGGVTVLERAARQLERDIRKDFFELLLKRENIRLLEQSLETARKRYEQVSTSYEHGLVSELDKLNAQVNLDNLRPDLEKARTEYETAAMEFRQALGLARDTELLLEGSIETEVLSLEAEGLIRRYGSRRLDLRVVLGALAVLENDRKITASQEFGPALNLSYSYSVSQSDPFSAAGWSGAGWSGRSSLGVGLSVPIDGVIPSSASRVRLADLDDRIRQTNLELIERRLEGEIRIRTLVSNIERSGLSIDVLRKNAELARRVYELTEQEYEAGLTDLLTLEESYDDLQEARLKVLTEQYNYRSLLLDLEYEINASLGD